MFSRRMNGKEPGNVHFHTKGQQTLMMIFESHSTLNLFTLCHLGTEGALFKEKKKKILDKITRLEESYTERRQSPFHDIFATGPHYFGLTVLQRIPYHSVGKI